MAPKPKSILIEGWRGINHSFALVNQHQILELLKFDGLTLFHRDVPFAYAHWTRAKNGAGLTPSDQGLVDALDAPPDEGVDCVYRIAAPFRAGTRDDRRKTVTFMVTELGLSHSSFEPGRGDSAFFTRDDNLIVTPTRWSGERLADWGFAPDKIVVVPHGVDGAIFHPLSAAERQRNRAGLGFADDEVVFLNVGLAAWNKGIDALLLAFATLRSQGRKVRLILKDQRDVYGRSVAKMIGDLGADHPELVREDTLTALSVVSTNMSRAELRLLYGTADCYVSPYRAEGFNLPVLEAVACGTPVIVTRGGSTDDFCDDDLAIRIPGLTGRHEDAATGYKGTFIEPNMAALIEAMDAFTQSRSPILPNFAQARARLLSRFTWAAAARQLARVMTGEPAPDDATPPALETLADIRGPMAHGHYHSDPNDAGQARTSRAVLGLVNVALGGTATQSSLSPWSRDDDAAHAISGWIDRDFAFHTDREDGPWWQVDLGAVLPIEVIVVHNRLTVVQDRATSLKVEIAERDGEWTLVHAGYAQFGARGYGHPLELWIGSALNARYIRLSLATTDYLHLSQVEIFARRDLLAFEDYRRRNGLVLFERTSTDFGRPYAIAKSDAATSDTIIGLKISHSGRFGNLVQQYTHMIQLARKTGLRYVQLGANALFDVKTAFEVDGITFLPADAPLPTDEAFIVGSFFNADPFRPLLNPFLRFAPEDEAIYSFVAKTYLRPYFLTGIPLSGEQHFDDELTIHIRSGDLFQNDQSGNRWYRQPPLSFYTLVVERMRARGTITRVRLVFEDRGNPCIDALEAWLRAHEMTCRIQCGSLHADMSALIDAPHLVFGYGTFGYAACRLSKRIKTLHFFAPELGGSYADIPCIDEVVVVSDGERRYIEAGKWNVSAGGWEGTPDQLALMVTYPVEALRIETPVRSV